MSRSPPISVIVPVLNGAETISQTLTGLRHQTGLEEDFEIIVVDNGSTDGTREVVEGFDVNLLEEPKRGPSAARNCGLRAARGDITAYLDADTVPTRRWLAELVKPFTDGSVVLVGGRTLCFPPETPAQRYTAQCGRYEPENNIHRAEFPFAPSQNLAALRNASLVAGGWSDDLLAAEDVDFCHSILTAYPDKRIEFAAGAVLLHHERATDEALRKQAWSYGQGMAEMYLRYPDELGWDLTKTFHLFRVLTTRTTAPLLFRTKRVFGLATADQVEFAIYHRFWTWWWWRGFFSVYSRKTRVALP